jgi:hypothetical protein
MPRTFNPDLADFVSLQDNGTNNRNFRLTHRFDIVPNSIFQAEPSVLFPINRNKHISPEYFITTDNLTPPNANDINIISGNDADVDIVVLPQAIIPFSADQATTIAAHGFYFNPISQCSSNPFPRTFSDIGLNANGTFDTVEPSPTTGIAV